MWIVAKHWVTILAAASVGVWFILHYAIIYIGEEVVYIILGIFVMLCIVFCAVLAGTLRDKIDQNEVELQRLARDADNPGSDHL